MKLLAFETSTELCSAALWVDGELDSRETHAGQRHSELLLPMIDELLAAHGYSARALDGIAIGAGPGSFTGLRIACGVAQGIALAVDIPVAQVSTLLALAERSQASRAVCCLDARMGEVYHAAYVRDGQKWRTVFEPRVCPPAAVPQLPSAPWVACGNGFAAYREVLTRRYQGSLENVLSELAPHAREIATLAIAEFESGNVVVAENAAPLYIRDKVALDRGERERAAR